MEEIFAKDAGTVKSTKGIVLQLNSNLGTEAFLKSAHLLHVNPNKTISVCNVRTSGKNQEKTLIMWRELPTDFECFAPAAAIVRIKGTNAGLFVFFANSNNNKIYHYPFAEVESAKYEKSKWKQLGE